MPFCSWCQMETEVADVCAWCKRPLHARSIYGSFDYVREDDDHSSTSERMMPIFASLVLICFMVAIGFAIANVDRRPVASAEKPETIAELSAPVVPNVQPTSFGATQYTPPPNASQGSQGTPFTAQSGYRTAEAKVSNQTRPTQAIANSEGGVSATLDVSNARFRLAKTVDGAHILYGEVDLRNTGAEAIKQAVFTLHVDGEPILLDAYAGEIHRPQINHAPVIPMGESTVFLINSQVPLKLLVGGNLSLSVTGRNSNGPLGGAVRLELQG